MDGLRDIAGCGNHFRSNSVRVGSERTGEPMIEQAWQVVLATALLLAMAAGARAADPRVERGRYLVEFGGCNDCHTPGYFMGKPDTARYLGGSDVGFAIPGQGVFVAPNLTPDKATGLGNWTVAQIVTAITTGVRPDGRVLAPPMPWREFSHLTRADALDIALYLKTLPPVIHKVPGPFGVSQKPDVFVMVVMPPDVYAGLPKP